MKPSNKIMLSKKNILKAIFAVLLSATAVWAQPSSREYKIVKNTLQGEFVRGEILVKYKDTVTPLSAMELSRKTVNTNSVIPLSNIPRGRGPMHLIKSPEGMSVEQAIAEFSKSSDVEFAQPNYIYHATTNDTQYGQLWGLKNTSQTISSPTYTTNNPGTSGNDINAETAWNTITNCSSVVVAVIDSGVNYNHEDLSTNIVSGSYTCPIGTGSHGCDFVGSGDNNPMDVHGHGTHVAGTIGAAGNNSKGTTGVCWTASILAVRVLDANGSGTTADIVEGINFASSTGAGSGNAKIINMSLGGSSSDPAFISALDTAESNDVVVVVAAGNSTQNHKTIPGYPCDYSHSNIICVAAMDQSYAIADFSDYDSNSIAANRKVDIGAPGTNIVSTYFGTETVIFEYFSSGWTYSPAASWAYSSCLGYDSIITPTTWCSYGTPGNSLNNIAYKQFNLSPYSGASLYVGTWLDLSQSGDTWSMNYKAAGGDPFSSGTVLDYANGSIHTGGIVYPLTYDISSCNTATCTIGFRHTTDGTSNQSGDGVWMGLFNIVGKTVTTNAYEIMDGTSMASPHVAGIATMVRARNPSFTLLDTVNAILTGGDPASSIATITKTGKVADAAGSLKYIPPSEGVILSTP